MIVMDLEWNHGTVDKQLLLEGRTLRFEIIQIGAVQVDNLGNICKTFERLVMPCVHRTIMPKVIELTGITDRSLKGQQGFVQVWQDFCRWAGEEEEIAFWGNCDKAVLLSNLLYHKIDGGESLQMYDLQAMFDCAFLKSGQQTSLSAAIEQLGLPPYGSYHSALSFAVKMFISQSLSTTVLKSLTSPLISTAQAALASPSLISLAMSYALIASAYSLILPSFNVIFILSSPL